MNNMKNGTDGNAHSSLNHGSAVAVTVGAKRTFEYVLLCLGLINRGVQDIELVAIGQCISKACNVARILANSFGVTIGPTEICQLERRKVLFTRTSTRLNYSRAAKREIPEAIISTRSAPNFVGFPIYHLLFDLMLNNSGDLTIGDAAGNARILSIEPAGGSFTCKPSTDLFSAKKSGDHDHKQLLENVLAAFYRCGLVLSRRWEQVCAKVGESDDVILGLDTNIIYDCVVTQQLLDGFVLTGGGDFSTSPNWILIVVPATVMHEIEQWSNRRDDKGNLNFIGRKGYRALQEVLEIDQSRDIRGISLLITGESDPSLDARVEIRGLRDDLKTAVLEIFERLQLPGLSIQERQRIEQRIQHKLYRKYSAGDTVIRDQFKAFLRQISFHKGAFFLTGDKSNSALGEAEGLQSILLPKHHGGLLLGQAGGSVKAPRVKYGSDSVDIHVPLGKLIYELAVQFGSLSISWKNENVRVACDLRGELIDRWLYRDLNISIDDLTKLLVNYRKNGWISLADVRDVFIKLKENFMA